MREALLALAILCLVVFVGMTPRGALFLALCLAVFMGSVELGSRWHRGIWSWPTCACGVVCVVCIVFDPLRVNRTQMFGQIISASLVIGGWVVGITHHPFRRTAARGGG